ncbi:MFS transporter [Schlesneria paludicola]|uniref:MFS transporter n=1 Tax=Schlesneria paludicola TaxID=360056 RepID=UPI00029AF301|nr:MFS transporter [Schlesneria paludicola]
MPLALPADERHIDTSAVYGRTFWLAYFANSALVMANALTFRFAELVHFLGGSESRVGDIVALGVLVAVGVRFSFSHLLDDYGTRRMWPACSILFISGCVLFVSASHEMWMLYLARIAFFVGLTGMFACSMTHIQNHVPPSRRTEIIGNLGSSGFVGMILGSNLGDWILYFVKDPQTQFFILFGGAGLIGVVYLGIVLVLTHGQDTEVRSGSPMALRLMFRFWPGTVVLAAMTMGLGITATQTFLTRYATSQKIEGIGVFFTGYAISAFVFRLLVQNWSRTIGRHWMLVRGLLGHATGHLLLAFVTDGWQFILPSIICGFGHALLFPAVVSLGSGTFPKECRGAGTAIILGFTDFGSLIYSPLLGRISDEFGFHVMYCVSSGVALATALGYILVARYHPDHEAAAGLA